MYEIFTEELGWGIIITMLHNNVLNKMYLGGRSGDEKRVRI